MIPVVNDSGFLGHASIVTGNTERYRATFAPFLQDRATLASVTAAVTAGITSAVSSATLSNDHTAIRWDITAGTAGETFTLTLTVTTTDGQTLHYTLSYEVVVLP